MRKLLFLLLLLSLVPVSAAEPVPEDTLEMVLLREGVYLHRTFMSDDTFGRFDCNGLVYVVAGEALIVDAPPSNALSRKLVERINDELDARVVGVVVGHTHADSMGGLQIPSYGSIECLRLAQKKGLVGPLIGFSELLEMEVGGRKVQCAYFGPGHTAGIAVTYLVEERVLFGGCLIKALGAGRGYVGEAVVSAWSDTVEKIRAAYPEVEVVVPGHGECGGAELLNFTIDMFAGERAPRP
jgi:metallo-beta-lactamase class B